MIQKTALVIDDETPMIQIVKTVLANAGYTVYSTTNGEEGVGVAERHRPGVIVLDRYMPNMDGNEVLQKLKTNPATAHIPVVMLTGENKIDEIKSSVQLGAAGYIIKPFKSGDFIKKVDKAFEDAFNQP